MSADHLVVLLQGEVCGYLSETPDRRLSFEYDTDYRGVDLSVRMPRSGEVFGHKIVLPFLLGLLPDNDEVRGTMARAAGCSPWDAYALLGTYGWDVPGAVQICTPHELNAVRSQQGGLSVLSEEDIAQRLRRVMSASAAWEDDNEHWSLGGMQGKLALRLEGSQWCSCTGSSATTHILKPGVAGLSKQALTEFVCMRIAKECGLSVSNVDYGEFDGVSAIVIERYDRFRGPGNEVLRVHQEDLCQAFSVRPQSKYTADGGPDAAAIIRLLRKSSDDSVRAFLEMLAFNYLVGATDAHAKNYSILHIREAEFALAPAYDIASILPYVKSRIERHQPYRVAMSIGRENRIGLVKSSNIDAFEHANELDPGSFREIYASLAHAIPVAATRVVDELAEVPGVSELGDVLVPRLNMLCNLSIQRLSAPRGVRLEIPNLYAAAGKSARDAFGTLGN